MRKELYWLLRDYEIDGSERLNKGGQYIRGLYVDTIFKAFERYRKGKDVPKEPDENDDDDDATGGSSSKSDGSPEPPQPAGENNIPLEPAFQPAPPTPSEQVVEPEEVKRCHPDKNQEVKNTVGDTF